MGEEDGGEVMELLWICLALFLGLWTGLLLPLLLRKAERHEQRQLGRAAERGQEQILTEWLYGAKQLPED